MNRQAHQMGARRDIESRVLGVGGERLRGLRDHVKAPRQRLCCKEIQGLRVLFRQRCQEENRMMLGEFPADTEKRRLWREHRILGQMFLLRQSICFSLNPTKKSRVISKLSQLLAILGATFIKFGTMPLYKPRNPSCLIMILIASQIDLYWYPIPVMVLIWKRRRRTSLSSEISIYETEA